MKGISKTKKELITELEMLRESEEKHRDLYEESPVAYFSVGPDAKILRVNKQTAQLVG